MAKAKKGSGARSRKLNFRVIDGVFLLLVGMVGALAMHLNSGLRTDMNSLLHSQQVIRTELAPRLAQDIDMLRSSMMEINHRLQAPKKAIMKGKKTADVEEPAETLLWTTSEAVKAIFDKAPISAMSRFPSSVDGRENGKSLTWVYLQIANTFFWLLVLAGMMILILKLLETTPEDKH